MSQASSAPLYVPARRRQANGPAPALGAALRPHPPPLRDGYAGARAQARGPGRMVRYYLLPQWYHLSDPGAEETVKDAAAMRGFRGLGGQDPVSDETTLCQFRHLCEGTREDATLMAAPSSTQNRSQTRDPEMKSTRKGPPWPFGLQVPIGTDRHTRLIHRVTTPAAHVHDSQITSVLRHGGETDVWGDAAYQGQEQACQAVAPGVALHIPDKRRRGQELTDAQKAHNRQLSPVRCRVEHPFLVCKRLFGGRKVRYRGLAKNTQCAYVHCGLTHIYLVKDTLAAYGDMP